MELQETSLGSQLLAAFPVDYAGRETLELPAASVELLGAQLEQAVEQAQGPVVASVTSLTDQVAKSFQDPFSAAGLGFSLRSAALSVDLRRGNGSKLVMKGFTAASVQ